MANPASMAMWLSSCARSLAIYGGLVRMHTVAARPARYISPDVITAALEPEVSAAGRAAAMRESARGCRAQGGAGEGKKSARQRGRAV